MKRLHEQKIDDAPYYEHVWNDKIKRDPTYDKYRHEALIKYVTNRDYVVDVGAGVFGSCQYIAEKTDIKAKLVCIDQSYTAKEMVDKLGLKIRYNLHDVMDIPKVYNKKFNVVISGETIEHMEDPKEFAHKLTELCKKNGWISISTVNTNSEAAKKHGDYPEHIWEFTPKDLISFFKPYGETVYDVIGNYHIIHCKKY